MKRPIALLAILPVVLAIAACGSSSSSTSGAAPSATSQAGSSPALMVASKANVGSVLVDAQGRTLYRYTPDKTSKSTCTGACAQDWPPATIQGSEQLTVAGAKGTVSTTTRSDGSKQLVFDGKPLYRFASDASKADALGQGVQNIWFVLPAKSTTSGAAAASKPSTTTTPKSSYGY